MAKTLNEFTKKVIRLIKSVPKGKVATYGQIAKLAGRDNGARAVCQVLAQHGKSHQLPWFRIINSQGRIAFKSGTKHFKIQKGHLQKEKIDVTNTGRINLARYQWKKKVVKNLTIENSFQPTIEDVTRDMNEDFLEAWNKLRSFTHDLGEQRIYASAKAVMFARDVCYLFVRPKKSYLEIVFFLNREFKNPWLKPYQVSKTKWGYVMRVIHQDQIEQPLTDWLREAFETVSTKSGLRSLRN